MNIKKSVKFCCYTYEKTQADLARYLGFSPQYLHTMLKENKTKHIQRMAEFFEIPVSEFISYGE